VTSLWDDVLEELCADPQVSRGVFFGRQAAKLGRRVFAFERLDDIVVKLGPERVDEMVEAGRASVFQPGGHAPMGNWAVVPPTDSGDPVAAWVELAEEAKDRLE
jgi:hypothetical protein